MPSEGNLWLLVLILFPQSCDPIETAVRPLLGCDPPVEKYWIMLADWTQFDKMYLLLPYKYVLPAAKNNNNKKK